MKKLSALVLSLVLCMTVVSSAMAATTVEFWHAGSGATGATITAAVEAFNKTVGAEKGIEVKEVFQGSYDETLAKTMNAIAAGNQPAIVMLERSTGVATMASNGALATLDDYVTASGMDMSDFLEILLYFSYDAEGNLISLPYMRSNAVYYYNKTMFDELGLTPPATIDELVEVGKKLHKVNDKGETEVYGFEMYCMSAGQWVLQNMLVQLGSNCFSEDGNSCPALEDGTMLTVLKAWKSWVDEGWCSIPSITDTGTVLRQNFAQGKIASMIYSCGSMNGILDAVAQSEHPFEVGVAYVPTFGIQTPPVGGNNIALVSNNNSKEVLDAAWEFVNFLMSPEQAALSSAGTGYVPATKSAAATETIQKLWAEKPTFKVAYDQLLTATIEINRSDYSTDFLEALNKAASLLIQDQSITPEEAVQLLKDEAAIIFP